MRPFVIAAYALVTACAVATPPAPPAPRTATDVSASFNKTWEAVIDQFANENIPIRTVDKASGIIATEVLQVPTNLDGVADCGRDMGVGLRPTHASYNVLVRGDSAKSTVRINVRWTRTGMARGLSTATVTEECSTRSVWEPGIEAKIKTAAEAKR